MCPGKDYLRSHITYNNFMQISWMKEIFAIMRVCLLLPRSHKSLTAIFFPCPSSQAFSSSEASWAASHRENWFGRSSRNTAEEKVGFWILDFPSSNSTTFYLRRFANFIDHLRARRVHIKNPFPFPSFLIRILLINVLSFFCALVLSLNSVSLRPSHTYEIVFRWLKMRSLRETRWDDKNWLCLTSSFPWETMRPPKGSVFCAKLFHPSGCYGLHFIQTTFKVLPSHRKRSYEVYNFSETGLFLESLISDWTL